MDDNLFGAMTISAYGMRAQGERLRMITENVANAATAAPTPNEDPYSRKIITFQNELDRKLGMRVVTVEDIDDDTRTPFPIRYMPDHPGADEAGYVRMPNVNTLIEMTDMREAQRTYEANLAMIQQSRTMAERTIDVLR